MARIVVIHSFRGGTGKSNLTANLSVIVALSGKRVGVIDTDIQSPGIHVLFGLEEDKMTLALNDYLWGKCGVDNVAYDVSSLLSGPGGQSCIAGPGGQSGDAASGGLYLIPSSLKTGEITRVLREGYDVGRLNDGFRELVRNLRLDYLFIDTHPGLNEETLLSIAISEALVVVLRPDRQDFQGTAVTVEVARKLDVPWMCLVINKALPEFDFTSMRRQMEEVYGVPVAGVLPENLEMIRLGSSGVFCLRFPDHPFSQALRDIAQQLMTPVPARRSASKATKAA